MDEEKTAVEWCVKICERAYPSSTAGLEEAQYGCPHHFNVDYRAATINGKQTCKHLKRKKEK